MNQENPINKSVQDIQLIVKSNGGYETQEQIDINKSIFQEMEKIVNEFVKTTLELKVSCYNFLPLKIIIFMFNNHVKLVKMLKFVN